MEIVTIVTGELQTNTYLIIDNETKDAVLVDPAAEPERILEEIEESHANIKAILVTHGHFDHIGAVDIMARKFKVPVVTHAEEGLLMASGAANLSLYFYQENIVAKADTFIEDEQVITFGPQLTFKCLIVPGHTAKSVCYYNEKQGFVMSGDTLMSGSVGRTDLYQNNMEAFILSIKEKLMTLPDETLVYSGHGYTTSIIVEKKSNSYL